MISSSVSSTPSGIVCNLYSEVESAKVSTISRLDLTIGKETVTGPIEAGHAATLNGTTVQGNDRVSSGHAMILIGVSAGNVVAGDSATISTSTLQHVKSVFGCTITETEALDVRAGHQLVAEKCPSLRNISSGCGMKVQNCPSVFSVQAGHSLTMENCNVTSNVEAGLGALVKNSKIGGYLSFTCGKNKTPKLENITCPKVVITYKEGGLLIDRSTQGYQNKITLPEEYADGIRQVSSRDYRYFQSGQVVHYSGEASQIFIKGRRLSDLIQGYGEVSQAKKSEAIPEIVLTLEGECKIGEVVFKQSKGKVVYSDGSTFTGTVSSSL